MQLNHLASLAKWLSFRLRTKWFWVQGQLHSVKLQILRLFWERSSLTFRNVLLECWFSLKRVCDMIRTCSQIYYTDKQSQQSSIILSVWLNNWVCVYELSGCGLDSRYSHLNFSNRTCFEEGVPWHSGRYRVWVRSKTRMWHDKNMQSNVPYR